MYRKNDFIKEEIDSILKKYDIEDAINDGTKHDRLHDLWLSVKNDYGLKYERKNR